MPVVELFTLETTRSPTCSSAFATSTRGASPVTSPTRTCGLTLRPPPNRPNGSNCGLTRARAASRPVTASGCRYPAAHTGGTAATKALARRQEPEPNCDRASHDLARRRRGFPDRSPGYALTQLDGRTKAVRSGRQLLTAAHASRYGLTLTCHPNERRAVAEARPAGFT